MSTILGDNPKLMPELEDSEPNSEPRSITSDDPQSLVADPSINASQSPSVKASQSPSVKASQSPSVKAQNKAQGVDDQTGTETTTKPRGESSPGTQDEGGIVGSDGSVNHGSDYGYLGWHDWKGFYQASRADVQMRGELGSNNRFEVTQEYVDDFESLGVLVEERSKINTKLRAPLDDVAYYDDFSDDDEVVPGIQINQKDGYTINKKAFREWQKQQTFEKPTEEEAYSGPALRPPVDDTSDHDDDFYSDDEVDTAHCGLKQQTCDLHVPDNLSRFYGLESTTWHDSDIKGDKNLQPTTPGPAWTGSSSRAFREANKAFAETYWKDGVKLDVEEEYTGPGLSPPIDDTPLPSKRNKTKESPLDSPSNSSSKSPSQDAFESKGDTSPASPSTSTNQDGVQKAQKESV